jgi:hypothetical protein
MRLPLHLVSAKRYFHTLGMAILVSCLIVGVAATLGRATLNLHGAVIRKPDIAVLVLMEARDEEILDSTLLKESQNEREYLVETKTGSKWVLLKRGVSQWYIAQVENLRE